MKKNPIFMVTLAALLALGIVYGCSWLPMRVEKSMSAIAYGEDGNTVQAAVFAAQGTMTRPLFHSSIFKGSVAISWEGEGWGQEQKLIFSGTGDVETAHLPLVGETQAQIRMTGNFEEVTITGFIDSRGEEWTLHAPADTLR